jgi:hypothetical protein
MLRARPASRDQIAARVYQLRPGPPPSAATIKAHISQINAVLAGERIRADRAAGVYRLERL